MHPSDWQNFLEHQGAEVIEGTSTRQFTKVSVSPPAAASKQLFDLSEMGCIWLEGADAAKFLQGQVTCDLNEVTDTQFRRGAICNLQGRMICSFRLFKKADNQFGLLMHRGLLDSVNQWLSKYIVFSKAKTRIDSDFVAMGFAGEIPEPAASHIASLPKNAQGFASIDDGVLLQVDEQRYLAWLPVSAAKSLWQKLADSASLADERHWRLHDIRAGFGEVFPATAGEFIPQMIGLEHQGGVSFKKGCYIGQEVVARMQYLGKLKRHLQRAKLVAEHHPKAGDPLFVAGSKQSIGNVVSVAPIGPDTFELLAVVTDAAREADAVYHNTNSSEKLHFLSPPYAITK